MPSKYKIIPNGVSSEDIQKARQRAKRSRASAACIRCKAAKIKCSDYRPCKNCVDSRKSEACEDSIEDEQPEQKIARDNDMALRPARSGESIQNVFITSDGKRSSSRDDTISDHGEHHVQSDNNRAHVSLTSDHLRAIQLTNSYLDSTNNLLRRQQVYTLPIFSQMTGSWHQFQHLVPPSTLIPNSNQSILNFLSNRTMPTNIHPAVYSQFFLPPSASSALTAPPQSAAAISSLLQSFLAAAAASSPPAAPPAAHPAARFQPALDNL
jgi:23S rRNA U2552 (ribose-2'-O)-methylase RlmE/FtsJ